MNHLPRQAQLLVDRPRLTARLDERPPLTLLRAPVGFGKTTLVGQWLAARRSSSDPNQETIAWLRVRPQAGALLADAWRVLSDVGLPMPARLAPTDATELASQIERALLAFDRPVLLVVDEFEHVTDSSAEVALLGLLRRVASLRVIVCLRSHRHFPAFRFYDLETVVLTARDLRFTDQETGELLVRAGVEVSRDVVQSLRADLGGWPEPTRAVALRLKGAPRSSPSELRHMVSGVATDYLKGRLLAEATTPGLIEFALRTSVAEEFTIRVAEVLADNHSARAHLEALGGEGMLLSTVRDGEVVYRWPRAARHALRAELERHAPDLLPELHRRLGRWYLEQDTAVLALRHAVASRDWRLAIEVIDSLWRKLIFEHNALAEAFAAVPIADVIRSPRALALRDSTLRTSDDRLLEVAVLPESERELTELGRRQDAAEVLDTCLAVILALRMRGAFDRARVYGLRALTIARAARVLGTGGHYALYARLHLHVGITQLLGDDVDGALQSLREAYEQGGDPSAGHVEPDAAGKLALGHGLLGDRGQANQWLRTYHESGSVHDTWLSPLIDSTATAAELLITLDELDLDRAARVNVKLADHMRRDEFWAFLLYARAQYALHAGGAADLLGILDHDRSLYSNRLDHSALARPLLAAAEADLLLALGRGNLARAVLNGPDARHPLLRVGRARLALLAGRFEVALRLAADSDWERSAGQHDRQAMLLIRASAARHTGDLQLSSGSLRRAVQSASATGSWRPFLTIPRRDLEALIRDDAEARGALEQSRTGRYPSLFPDEIALIELTEREQLVLADLAHGLTVPDIARAAVLSYNTVRTQQRSLYKKLGTSDRSEAISRAHELGLLPPS